MAEVVTGRFSCEACGRSFSWRAELAGRKAKCKCGSVIIVPQPAATQPLDDLYDFAPSEAEAKAAFSRKHAAAVSNAAPAGPTIAPAGIPLGYQQAPTQRERDRFSSSNILDMKRDVHVPVALLVIGFAIYLGFYAFRYELGGAGVAITSFGLGIITLFKAALLIGFALVVAGPLGVSFGGIFTAALKLAAMAVFCDGVTTWVDAGVEKVSGAGGGMAILISFPVAMAIYWVLLTYLFSMDSGDSWLVVVLLAIFDMIVRWVLMIILLQLVLGWGGVSPAAMPAAVTGAAPAAADPMVEHIRQLKEYKLLHEAREFIAGGRQEALTDAVNAWYAAGCKNVWFEVSRDINGKITPNTLIVELPKDKVTQKEHRARCYAILQAYFDEHNIVYDPEDVTDTGDNYITMWIR